MGKTIDFEVNSAFVYYRAQKEETKYICKRTPLSSPARGDEEYYEWRFNNFMERHVTCAHEPPVYYYGLLEDPVILLKKQDEEAKKAEEGIRSRIKEVLKYIQETWDDITLNPKQLWLGLDPELRKRQKKAKQYVKNDHDVMPNISKSYGYKYCLAFGKLLNPKLSAEGQIWMSKALNYLQEYMEAGVVDLNWVAEKNKDFNRENGLYNKVKREAFYTDIELNNARFEEFAFATHPDAYLNAEMEKVPLADLVRISITPDLKEWGKGATWLQAKIVAKELAKKELQKALEKINEKAEEIKKKIESIIL